MLLRECAYCRSEAGRSEQSRKPASPPSATLTPMPDMYPDVSSLLRAHGVSGDERALSHNGFSGARVTVLDGGYILKRIRHADDWIMRETKDDDGREAQFAASPIVGRLPKQLAVPSLGAAHDGDDAAILMRDITPLLLPDGEPIDAERIDLLLAALATMHAEFWDDDLADAGGLVVRTGGLDHGPLASRRQDAHRCGPRLRPRERISQSFEVHLPGAAVNLRRYSHIIHRQP